MHWLRRAPANPRLQRTPAASPPSPLNRKPLGDRSFLRGAAPALVGVVLALTACDGGIYARGIVQTQDANPIVAATVVLARPKVGPVFGTTDRVGCFHISRTVAPGRYFYSLVATAPGYKPLVVDVRTLHRNYVEITLAPENSQVASTARVTDVDKQGGSRESARCSSP